MSIVESVSDWDGTTGAAPSGGFVESDALSVGQSDDPSTQSCGQRRIDAIAPKTGGTRFETGRASRGTVIFEPGGSKERGLTIEFGGQP